jgi:hypothetical protein
MKELMKICLSYRRKYGKDSTNPFINEASGLGFFGAERQIYRLYL